MPKKVNLKPMTIGWRDCLKEFITKPPEGYSNCKDIAKRLNLAPSTVRMKLKALAEEGKIDRVEVKIGTNVTYYYRD